jgi:hypothetical protein
MAVGFSQPSVATTSAFSVRLPVARSSRTSRSSLAFRLSYGERGDVVLPSVVPYCLHDFRQRLLQ